MDRKEPLFRALRIRLHLLWRRVRPPDLLLSIVMLIRRTRDGRFGLWLDRNFYKGSSARCPAYDNEVLCDPLGSVRESTTFECYGLEVWAT